MAVEPADERISREMPAPPAPGRSWPAIAALATTWLCPATSARRLARVSLWSAWAVHVAAIVLAFLLSCLLIAVHDRTSLPDALHDLSREASRDWQATLFVAGSVFLLVEIVCLLLALLVMPWGARDEPVRASWSHALRLAWLHTAHALPLILLAGVVFIWLERQEQAYRTAHPQPSYFSQPPPPPTPPVNKSADPQAYKNYRVAIEAYNQRQKESYERYQEAWRHWYKNRPLGLLLAPAIGVGMTVVGYTWFFWALLRAVGASRAVPPADHSPLCEFCGYNLTGAAADGRCPECGQPVADSLGPDVRRGTPWDRRADLGRWRAWRQSAVNAVLRPTAFGRQIRVRAGADAYRVFLAGHLAACFAVVWAGAAASLIFEAHRYRPADVISWVTALGPSLGFSSFVFCLGLVLLSAAVIGLHYSARNGTNLLPAAIQAASYLGGYLLAWTCFATAGGVIVYAMDQARVFNPPARQLRMAHEVLAFFCWLLPNLAWLVVYAILLRRSMAGAQYANR